MTFRNRIHKNVELHYSFGLHTKEHNYGLSADKSSVNMPVFNLGNQLKERENCSAQRINTRRAERNIMALNKISFTQQLFVILTHRPSFYILNS